MSNKPKIEHFLDEEERLLVEAIESDDYVVGKNNVTPKRLKELQVSARATMNEERTRISLRVPKTDLSRLKAQAMKAGIPYQTLINSILHKAVNE